MNSNPSVLGCHFRFDVTLIRTVAFARKPGFAERELQTNRLGYNSNIVQSLVKVSNYIIRIFESY